MRIADTSTREEYERDGERRSGGFWSWLFGTDETDAAWNSDVDYYSEGLGRGGAVLTVDADDARAGRVQQLLEASGARCVVACDAGCLMQMKGGLGRRGSGVRAVHLAELLDRERGGVR